MGLDQEFISLDEVKKKHPLIDPKKYLLALWDPIDGEVDPSGVTYAFAKAAKVHGGKYYTHTLVKDTKQKPDGPLLMEYVYGALGNNMNEIHQLTHLLQDQLSDRIRPVSIDGLRIPDV